MAVVVDQAKLVLNAFAAIFENNLVSKDLVTWKKYDSEMSDTNRLTVVEQVGPQYQVTRTTAGVKDLTAGVQDSVFGSEQFIMNDTFEVDMGFSDFEMIRDIGSARESEALKNAALRLATRIDAYVLGYATLASNNWTGTAGNAISDFDDVASGFTRLKEEGVEDPDLRAVLTYGDKQALASQILYGNGSAAPAVGNAALPDMGAGMYREGFSGSIAGIPTLFTQQLPTLTAGTHVASGANVKMNAASQNVNYSAVAVSPAPGQYMTQTINITVSAAGTETVVDGEVFTIAGVFAYDPRLGASLAPRLQQFRVIGNYTAVAGAITNMRIFPAIIVPGTGTGGDIAVNNANATVDSVPGAAALITFMTAASAAYKPRLLMNKQAVIVNTRDLAMPYTGTATRTTLSKIPLSVRLWKDSVFATGQHRIRFDVALTANIRDRRRLIRING